MPHLPASPVLARLRVLDLTRARAGPTCVKHLADFGADVIKIESPPGLDENAAQSGPRDGPDMQNLHRNKRSMTLNLKSKEGLAIFMKLVANSDVVVENYRPDVKVRLGIDYASLAKVNPRIILASVSGFGQDGPYQSRPGVDQIAQGMGGIMMVTGRPGEGPIRVGAAVCDMTAGFLASLGVMTALYERETSGVGQWVQTNLLHSAIALLDFQAARYTVEGDVPEQVGNDHPTGMPTSAYRTRDGFINIGAAGDGMWRRLCKAIDRETMIDHPDFKLPRDRAKNRIALNRAIDEALAVKTSAEWIDLINAAGVPCGPIYTMDKVFADPQVKHIKAARPVKHPRLGEIDLIAPPITMSRTPATLARATPDLGEHTDEVLAEIGCSAAEIAALREQKAI